MRAGSDAGEETAENEDCCLPDMNDEEWEIARSTSASSKNQRSLERGRITEPSGTFIVASSEIPAASDVLNA